MFRFRECETEEKPQLIIIPMVDVMLFLLVFFFLIAGATVPGLAVRTNPPETAQKGTFKPKQKLITISITKEGELLYSGKRYSPQELAAELLRLKRQEPNISVAIDADREASVQSLVSLLDVLDKAGVSSIGLLAKQKKEEANGR
jgi:biopolymer transport protein ExbD